MMKPIATHRHALLEQFAQRLSARTWLGPLFAVALLASIGSLNAQSPALSPAAEVNSTSDSQPAQPPGTDGAATEIVPRPSDSANKDVPTLPDFDIDLGTEEFENFGEEDFQVEKKLTETQEATVTAIKVAVVSSTILAVGLLIAFVARKMIKHK